MFQQVQDWGQACDSGDSPIEKLGLPASSSVESKNRMPGPGFDPPSSKARKKKIFLDELSNSVRPFDYIVKAGQLARPKT
jgi:hypothetical protein